MAPVPWWQLKSCRHVAAAAGSNWWMVESRPFANVTRVKNGHDDKPFITLYEEN